MDRLHARRADAEVRRQLRWIGKRRVVWRDQRPRCREPRSVSSLKLAVRSLWEEVAWGRFDDPDPQGEGSNQRETRRAAPLNDEWGHSESLDPDNVGDIADEGAGHRG